MHPMMNHERNIPTTNLDGSALADPTNQGSRPDTSQARRDSQCLNLMNILVNENYGYDSTTPGWCEERKLELAEALMPIADQFRPEGARFTLMVSVDDAGVRLNHLMCLTNHEHYELVNAADDVYFRIMPRR